jgi:DNA topoisomerase-1
LRHRKLDRNKVLACMTRLIDQAYFRVGSERYARENQTFGLATMRSRHLTVKGDTLIFEYVGKSHKVNHREVEDPTLAKIVSQLDDLPGYEIFKYYDEQGELVAVTSDDLNAYIKEIMGQDFSAKDFRTWAGTLIAAVALAEAEKVDSKAAQKRTVTAAIAEVAERLGNTPAIAKASYVDPRIVNHYLKGHTIAGYLTQIEHELGSTSDMSLEEYAVLQLLQHRLRHPKKA